MDEYEKTRQQEDLRRVFGVFCRKVGGMMGFMLYKRGDPLRACGSWGIMTS